jgi:hypothetical protein
MQVWWTSWGQPETNVVGRASISFLSFPQCSSRLALVPYAQACEVAQFRCAAWPAAACS